MAANHALKVNNSGNHAKGNHVQTTGHAHRKHHALNTHRVPIDHAQTTTDLAQIDHALIAHVLPHSHALTATSSSRSATKTGIRLKASSRHAVIIQAMAQTLHALLTTANRVQDNPHVLANQHARILLHRLHIRLHALHRARTIIRVAHHRAAMVAIAVATETISAIVKHNRNRKTVW